MMVVVLLRVANARRHLGVRGGIARRGRPGVYRSPIRSAAAGV